MKLYDFVFFASNICIPIGLFLYQYIKKIQKYENQKQQMSVSQVKFQLGNIFLLIILMLIFNVLSYVFRKDYTIMAVGMILKIITLYLPQKLNSIIQALIQKIHLQRAVQKSKIFFIELYLRVNWNINSILLSYLNKNQRTIILNQQKAIIEELETQSNPNISVSHKIIAQNLNKNVKYLQNTGVNCNIISAPQAQINKKILNYIKDKEKVPQKHKSRRSNDQMIPPTKQISISLNQNKASQSIMTQRPSKRQILTHSLLTERGNQIHPQRNVNVQVKQQSHNTKKEEVSKNNTKKYFQDQVFKKSLKNSQKSGQIEDYQKQSRHKINYLTQFQGSKSFKSQQLQKTYNPNNVGIIDINMSESSQILKNSLSVSNCLQEQFVKSQLVGGQQHNGQNIKQQKIRSSFLPSGVNISSIQIKKSHPFQVNLSSLSNPLRISKNEFLTPSLINVGNSQKFSSTNLENINKEILVQSFSQSSITKKLQQSVSESEYSDMFDSEQQNQNKVQCKVQAVVQRQKKENQPKARLQIYMIELYSNSDLKFYSLYDKVVFEGRLLRMIKKPDNYYDLIVQEYKNSEQQSKNGVKNEIKQVQSNSKQGVEITKRVKFRGQAKLFMKYLTK